MSIQYRIAEFSDLEDIYDVEKACFPGVHAYPKDVLRYFLERTDGYTIVAINKSPIIGFIMFSIWKKHRIAHIETIDVHPLHKQRGIGKNLLSRAEDIIREQGVQKIFLEVGVANTPALKLYKSHGYMIKKRIKDYYLYPHFGSKDAYKMIKKLD